MGSPLLTAWCAIAFVAVLIVGCGESSSGASVHGRVSYQGQPLTGAALSFYPESGRPVVTAITDGEYRVELPPSQYQVTVNIGTKLPPGWKEGDPLPPPKVILPPQYTQRATTQLTATVVADQQQPIDFELK